MNTSGSLQLGWFEIPVLEMERAKLFYESVFQIQIRLLDFGSLKMGLFPSYENEKQGSGALVLHPQFYFPANPHGVLIYLSCTNVADVLLRAVASGGSVLQQARLISAEFGNTGVFLDTEGNRIGLRSK